MDTAPVLPPSHPFPLVRVRSMCNREEVGEEEEVGEGDVGLAGEENLAAARSSQQQQLQ